MVRPFDVSKFRKSITKSIGGISTGFDSDPDTWISTGNYTLNYLISGDFNKGVPLGRVTMLAGESGSGKSLIASGNIIKNAQKKGIFCIVFDSENALDETTGGSIIPDDQTLGQKPTTMPFDPLKSSLKEGSQIVPRYFSRQMTAFDITLDMLMKANQAEVLADSRLTTLNGREASIKLVDIVPYILSSGGVGGQVQVQREEVGIKLDINPTVNTDGFITVKVEPEVSTIFEFIGPDNNIPRVKSRKSSTTIRVKDGESIIIGGLLSNDRKQTLYKFPLLHKLPWIGEKLFTSKNLVERKTDLIIQITPRIVVDNYTGIMKTDRMRSFEENLLGKSEDGALKNVETDDDEYPETSTYKGIWNDNSSLPEQIESDQE